MQDNRLFIIAVIDPMFADRPDIVRACGCDAPQVVISRINIGTRHVVPLRAVPMQRQSLVKRVRPWNFIAHSPYVVGGKSNDGVQVVVKSAEVGAIDRVPLCAVPMRGKRMRSAIVVLTHCPYIIAGESVHSKEGRLPGGVRRGHYSPLRPIPMHGERSVIVAYPVVSHRPDVIERNSRDAMQSVAGTSHAGAGNMRPRRAVPVRCERLRCAVVAALLSDNPDVLRADSFGSPEACVRYGQLRNTIPLSPVPMQTVRRRPKVVAHSPDIIG